MLALELAAGGKVDHEGNVRGLAYVHAMRRLADWVDIQHAAVSAPVKRQRVDAGGKGSGFDLPLDRRFQVPGTLRENGAGEALEVRVVRDAVAEKQMVQPIAVETVEKVRCVARVIDSYPPEMAAIAMDVAAEASDGPITGNRKTVRAFVYQRLVEDCRTMAAGEWVAAS